MISGSLAGNLVALYLSCSIGYGWHQFAIQRILTFGPKESDLSGCAGCGACGGVGMFLLLIPIVLLVLNVALLVWVARDAKARGMDSAVLWMLLVFFLSLLGLVIYLFSRPQGNLIRCEHCGNNRLQASAKCPHCGN